MGKSKLGRNEGVGIDGFLRQELDGEGGLGRGSGHDVEVGQILTPGIRAQKVTWSLWRYLRVEEKIKRSVEIKNNLFAAS